MEPQTHTDDVPIKPVPEKKPLGEPWPEPSSVPGDEAHVQALQHHLSAITDVGTLEKILNIVISRCRTYRVKPDVIKTAYGDNKPV